MQNCCVLKNFILLFLLVYFSLSLNAQSVSWRRVDSCSTIPVNSAVIICNNDIYTQISCDQQITYTNGTFSSPRNSIVRMSSEGDYKTSVGNFQGLDNFAVDNLRNIYVVGYDSLINNTYYSCCKFDSLGNLIWHFPVGTNYGLHVRYTTLVSDGFVFGGDWTNYSGPWGGSFNLFIAKTDFNGNLIFLHKFDNHDRGRIDNIITSGNNIFVSGSFSSELTLKDSVNSITLNGYTGYFAKYTSSGNLISATSLPRTVCPYSMIDDSFGNLVFGNWGDTVGIDLYKYTDTGTLISTEHIADAGSASGIDKLKFDSWGNLYIKGWFRDSITVNNSQKFYSNDLDSKSILFRRNTSGMNDWTLYPDCPNCYGGFNLLGKDDIVFNSFYRINTEVFGTHYYNSRGNILIRFQTDVINGVSRISFDKSVDVFPNPSTGIFTINARSNQEMQIYIYDLLGNCLMSNSCRSKEKPQIDLKNQSKGIYFMEILSDGERVVKKIVLQ